MHIVEYSVCTKATRLKAAVHYNSHSLSRGNLKNIMPRSFTFCVPALLMQFYLGTIITFNSCKTVCTYSMALATVNIDKIIKVTSASSYVYIGCSDVSEFEHIYGRIFTTSSCVYDRLFTWTRMVDFNALVRIGVCVLPFICLLPFIFQPHQS